MPWRNVAALLNESHLIDFLDGGNASANLGEAAFAQRDHAFFAGDALDFGGGAAIDNHFTDAVGQIEQFADGGAAMVTGALGEDDVAPGGRVQAEFAEFLGGVALGLLAVFADHANQALGQDAVERGNEVVRLDAHVDETADDVGNVIGVNGGKDEVAGERGLNGDVGGFLVSDFADHDFVGVVAKDGPQAAGKGEAFFLVYGNLRDAAELVFDGVFDRDDFVLVGLDFVDGGVKGGGLAGAGGTGDEHHAVGLANVAAEAADFFRREANDIQIEALKFFGERLLIEDTKDGIFAVARGHDGNAKVNEAALVLDAEAAVLRNTAFRDVEVAENLDAGDDCGVPFLGDGLHGVLENAVNAVFDGDFGVARLDMNIAGAPFERREDDGLDEANDGADGGIAREAITGNGFVALFVLFGNLQGKGFGGLFEDALGLLGTLEEIADLAGGGHFDGELFAEKKGKFIAEQDLAGIGHGDGEDIVLRFERNKVVAKHQVRGNSAKELGIDALLAQIDKAAAVAFSELASVLALVVVVAAGETCCWR